MRKRALAVESALPAPDRVAYHPTRAEMETVIRWDRDDLTVHLWTANPVVWRKLARLGVVPARETAFPSGVPSGKSYRLAPGVFRWGIRLRPRTGRPGGNPEALARARAARSPRSVQESAGNGSSAEPEAPRDSKP